MKSELIKKYKNVIIFVIIFLLSILIVFKFPGVYFILIMVIYDKFLKKLGKNSKFFNLGLENVTATALILGQITNLGIALSGTIIMIFMDKSGDIKMTFKGIFMDIIFWISFVIISSRIENYFMIISIVLIVMRFVFFKVLMIINGGSFEDLHKDFINLFYHITFIKLFSIIFLI